MTSAGERQAVAARFGENLRHARRVKGLSQEGVAVGAGLHRTEIGLLERGERVPRIDTVARLAGSLSVSPAELLEGISWERPVLTGGQLKVKRRKDE